MKKFLIHSFCKINLSLRVIKKLNTGFHKIQSLITFANLFDKISVLETNSLKDKINFSGKFKYNINSQKNSIRQTLDILRKYNYLKNKKFIINVKKNIPSGAGLGGGSMNSASLIRFFVSTYKLKISQKKILILANKIGSDVPLGLNIKNTFLINNNKSLIRTKSKLNLYVLLVNPGIKCLSKDIYLMNKRFSNPYPKKILFKFHKLFNLKWIKLDRNDLEPVVFKRYPKVKILNYFIKEQENCIFSRMTGSGSTCVGYFNELVSAKKAKKNIKKKFPGYWCVTAKTI